MSDLFDDIWDLVSGGQVTRAREERGKLSNLHSRLEKLAGEYNHWHSKGKVLSKALYDITILAFNEVCKLQDIIEHLTVSQRKIAEYTIEGKKYASKDLERCLLALNSAFDSSRQVLDTKQFAEDTLDGSLSILEKMPNSTGLATAGIYTVISGLDHYASLSRQVGELKAEQYEVLERIDKLKDRLLELKAKIYRAEEMGAGLGKGIKAFQHCYNEVYKKLFPKGEASKRMRETRQASGGQYFLDSEKPLLKSLCDAGWYLIKMVDAKP